MPRLTTDQTAALLHVRPQNRRQDRCRNKPEIPYLKTPTGRIFYDREAVIDWLLQRVQGDQPR